jgi:hypothetical protein
VELSNITDRQIVHYTKGNPREAGTNQDFSLVTDFQMTMDTGQCAMAVKKGSTLNMKDMLNGDLRIKSNTSGTMTGLVFKESGNDCAALDSLGRFSCNNIDDRQRDWLDNSGNLTGGLVFRGTDGTVKMHMSNQPRVRIRGLLRPSSL